MCKEGHMQTHVPTWLCRHTLHVNNILWVWDVIELCGTTSHGSLEKCLLKVLSVYFCLSALCTQLANWEFLAGWYIIVLFEPGCSLMLCWRCYVEKQPCCKPVCSDASCTKTLKDSSCLLKLNSRLRYWYSWEISSVRGSEKSKLKTARKQQWDRTLCRQTELSDDGWTPPNTKQKNI